MNREELETKIKTVVQAKEKKRELSKLVLEQDDIIKNTIKNGYDFAFELLEAIEKIAEDVTGLGKIKDYTKNSLRYDISKGYPWENRGQLATELYTKNKCYKIKISSSFVYIMIANEWDFKNNVIVYSLKEFEKFLKEKESENA